MNLVKTIENFNINYVYFCEPIKNNIMNDGNFIRILYSTSLFVLNGIYISFNINNVCIEKYYNKYKCIFDVNEYINTIEKICQLEVNILEKINIKDKIPQHKISEQFKYGHIKIFSEYIENNILRNNIFVLKISGVWETELHYGLTFKFIII
jgi:hypothetical protein